MSKKPLGRRWRWWLGAVVTPVLLGVGITFAAAAAQSMSVEGGLADLERSALGWMLLHRPSRPVDRRIAFVAVDTTLYEQQEAPNFPPEGNPGKPLEKYRAPGCECPGIPRECYALAVERLHRWGAKAVVLDIMFSRRGYSDVDKEEDRHLGDALFKANNVVAAAGTQTLALDRSRDPRITTNLILSPPMAAVADNATAVGSPQVEPQNKEYALEFLQTARDGTGNMVDYFSLPYLGYCVASQHPKQDLAPWKNRMVSGTEPRLLGDIFSKRLPSEKRGPADPKGDQGGVELITTGNVMVDEAFYQKHLLINFNTGADSEAGRFRPIRLTWLLSCTEAEGAKRFKGKLVLVGNPAVDLHSTLVGALPGTEVLANAVQTLLQDRPIVPAPNRDVLLITAILAVMAALALRQLPFLLAAIVVVLELCGLAGLSFEFLKRDVWLLCVTPISAIAATGVVTGLAQMKGIQKMVAQLVPERISRAVEHAGGLVVEEGTVMFSDIRGYSTFSEYMDPAQMMSMLNAYFGTVNAILDRYNGHFIKSPGDCVVAWFSDERKGAHHSERAIRAAIDLVINAVRFRDQWPSEQGAPFDIGVGMNSGPMAIGLLDAHRHVEPTVIGDTVNLASRIESLTKTYGATIIVSEETLAPVREMFLSEPLGEAMVKGRSQPVQLFRIVGVAPGAEEELSKWDLRRFRATRMWFGRERKETPTVPDRIQELAPHKAPPKSVEKEPDKEPQSVGAGR